jgi:hypothetical protein
MSYGGPLERVRGETKRERKVSIPTETIDDCWLTSSSARSWQGEARMATCLKRFLLHIRRKRSDINQWLPWRSPAVEIRFLESVDKNRSGH